MFRVMIVDDDDAYRRLVRAMLEREDDFQVVGEAADGSESLELMKKVDSDLILMDVQMQYMSGFEATRLILERHPEAKVILISRTRRRQEYSRMAREVGAIAFIAKQDLDINVFRQALQS